MKRSFSIERKVVIRLFLAALGLRILHYFLFADEIIVGGDQMQYIMLARNFAAGDFHGFMHTYWTPLFPFLIGVVSIFVDSLIIPALIVSVIAGSLAAPVTYFLVKQSYGRREAVIAAALAVFFPHLINSAVFDLGSETVYLPLITGALYFGWQALQKNALSGFLITGILFGLAYLTRPEAFAYPLYFAALVIVKNLFDRKPFSRRLLTKIGVLLLGFAILSAPYIFYLRSETGNWTISAKAKANLASGILANGDNTNSAASTGNAAKSIIKEIPFSLIEIHKNLPHLLPLFLMLFVGLGLFGKTWDRRRFEREAYLIAFCLITCLGYAASVVQTRYFYILLPIFFGWIAAGIIRFERWFYDSIFERNSKDRTGFKSRNAFVICCLVIIFFYVLPLSYFINKPDSAFEARDAGIWLKENAEKSPLIFSASSLPVFYAEGRQLLPETKDVAQIFEQLKNSRTDYVITTKRSLVRNPHLKDFTEQLENSPDFELIYRRKENTKDEISIFRSKFADFEN